MENWKSLRGITKHYGGQRSLRRNTKVYDDGVYDETSRKTTAPGKQIYPFFLP